jgi:hypothetical protein
MITVNGNFEIPHGILIRHSGSTYIVDLCGLGTQKVFDHGVC